MWRMDIAKIFIRTVYINSTFQTFPALHSRKKMRKAVFLNSSQLKDILHTYRLKA